MEVAYDMVDTLNSSSTVSWTNAPLTSDLYGTANTTDNSTTPQYVGYIGAGVAVLFYGSNFIPVKKFETGDGMFFQLVLCTAILFVGVIVNLIRNAPKFYPIVMLGGAFWATGNVCVVPIIKTIGMGLGLCIWGSSNLLAGWASGRFGMFGWIKPEEPSDSTLNYIGVSMAVLSTAIYLFVRSEVSTSLEIKVEEVWDPEREPLLAPQSDNPSINVNGWNPDVPKSDKLEKEEKPDAEIEDSFLERMSPLMKRIVGSVLSLISGIFYGISFAPAIHVQDMVEGSSQNGLDYVFAHFIGIYFTSLVYFIIYAAFMKNVPRVYPKMILPALLSGGMWGVATTCWFIANKVLSEPVSFPIITTGPGVVASLWGVLVFKEIQGRRNIILLILAFLATLTCGVLSGLSDR